MIHRGGKMSKYNLNDLSAAVVDSAIQVHRALGRAFWRVLTRRVLYTNSESMR
jgi:hypothetical protein